MNFKVITLAALVSIGLFSCDSGSDTATDTTAADTTATEEVVETVTYSVVPEESEATWKGGIVGGVYGHNGVLSISEGTLEVEGNQLVGGEVIIDMTTITPTDSNYSEDKTPEMLVGHLSTGDFFLIDSFPTAKFVIKEYKEGKVIGDLTIRDKTNEEEIEVTSWDVAEDGTISGSASFTFDRQKYDVAYKSTMKDVVIKDDIEVTVSLMAKK